MTAYTKNKKLLIIVLGLFVPVFCANAQLQPIQNRVQMESFLEQHDLKWTSAPKARGNSAFIGNGMLGSTIWSAREESLHWDLGRNNVYETGSRQFRMPIGKLVLKTSGKNTGSFQMRQSHLK